METTDNSDTDDEFDLDELIKQLEDLRTQEQAIIKKIKRQSHNNPVSRLNLVAEISNTTRQERPSPRQEARIFSWRQSPHQEQSNTPRCD